MANILKCIIFITFSIAFSQEDCSQPSCDDLEPGTPVGSIQNCQEYQICLSDGDLSSAILTCDENFHFDSNSSMCLENIEDYRCIPSCVPVQCMTSCDDLDDFDTIGVSGVCEQYKVCLNEEEIEQTCPDETPYYDSITGDCSESKDNCCDNEYLYCDTQYTQIPDPTNCKAYYLCLYEGIPTDADKYYCEDGELFDTDTCKIDEDGTCSGGVTGDPTTTVTAATDSTDISTPSNQSTTVIGSPA